MTELCMDYHIHSSVSPDSKESYEAIFSESVKKGLSEIMITEHFEFYSEGYESRFFKEDYLPYYRKTFLSEKEAYELKNGRKGLCIGFGIEFGQANQNPKKARRILSEYPFDYVIGSCHKIDNIDLSQYDYKEIDTEALKAEYLSYLAEIAKQDLYDCLGHIDLIKRYARRQGTDITLSANDERVREILKIVIAHGKGIEINTSGLRQNVGECLPSAELLRCYRELGGEILTVGSDAHRACDIKADFDTACEYIKSAGLKYLTRYKDRKPEMIKL